MKEDSVVLKHIYPIISNSLSKNTPKFKKVIERFMEARSKELFDTAPCSRLFFGADDIKDFYTSLNISEQEILTHLQNVYYWPMKDFNPRAAKDPFTIAALMVVRYFYMKNKISKETELAMIYLAFSGKFYPSIHSGSYPIAAPEENRHVMDFVINNKLNSKFDIKREGNVIGAIKSVCITWRDTYGDRLRSLDDEDVVYLIQQLHNRIKSFMKNIAEVYYDVYEHKDNFMVYSSDSLSEDNYHLADNDSLRIERIIEQSMTKISSSSVDYGICKMAQDTNVKTDELKGIIEAILDDQNNLMEIKELFRIIVSEYFVNSPNKDINDVKFITMSISAKPNSKNKNILRERQIIENWLDNNSSAYRRRKSREATKNSYFKSVLTYFVLVIFNANK